MLFREPMKHDRRQQLGKPKVTFLESLETGGPEMMEGSRPVTKGCVVHWCSEKGPRSTQAGVLTKSLNWPKVRTSPISVGLPDEHVDSKRCFRSRRFPCRAPSLAGYKRPRTQAERRLQGWQTFRQQELVSYHRCRLLLRNAYPQRPWTAQDLDATCSL